MVLVGLVWAVECGPVNTDRRVSGQPRGIVIFDCDRVWLGIRVRLISFREFSGQEDMGEHSTHK